MKVEIDSPVTLAKNSIFSPHWKDPQVFLPQPASTVVITVSVPSANDISTPVGITPWPSLTETVPVAVFD